jgi:hypothetical protein
MKNILFYALLVFSLFLTGCNFLFGTREDETVSDVFRQGAIDPNVSQQVVGYVPVLPIWGGFANPTDVFVGYDELVYVADAAGVHILDLKGTRQALIAIPGATKVVQDRRLYTYVLGRANRLINGENWNLAAVYVLTGAGTGNPQILDTLIHPFNDLTRANTNFRGVADQNVEFTGLVPLIDNGFYLSRRGPTNSQISTAAPDNSILVYRNDLTNNGYAQGLNANSSSLRSILDVSGMAGFLAPPQLVFGMSNSRDFLLLQSRSSAEYKTLWIRQQTSEEAGTVYIENQNMLNFDTTKATRFLYDSFRFGKPADICVAPDETNYIFVIDSEKDSLFQFTSLGFEGVNPPPNSGLTKQVIASFGGRGSGPFEFNQPQGVAYMRRIVYVADTGNGRIMRFKLSTDLER